MTTLHMEVEVARNTQSNMMATHEQLLTQISSMSTQIDGLRSAWMGNSATQFFSIYDTWKSQTNSLLEQLNQLGTTLNKEIGEWEAAASTF